MSEITICNGAKEIWSRIFKPADQRQPTRQHDFEAPALDGLDYRCRDKFRVDDQRSWRLRRRVGERSVEFRSHRTGADHGYVNSKGFELVIKAFAYAVSGEFRRAVAGYVQRADLASGGGDIHDVPAAPRDHRR